MYRPPSAVTTPAIPRSGRWTTRLAAGLVAVSPLLALGGAALPALTQAADAEKADHGVTHSRSPKPGTAPSGASTTSNPIDEGHEAGAPGAIVSTTESATLKAHDKDGDKTISAKEAAADPRLKAAFAKLDTNQNGALDAGEFKKYRIEDSAATGAAPTAPVEPDAR